MDGQSIEGYRRGRAFISRAARHEERRSGEVYRGGRALAHARPDLSVDEDQQCQKQRPRRSKAPLMSRCDGHEQGDTRRLELLPEPLVPIRI